ncbi:MAG TPA: ACT domain-containing protein [Ruminococcaceae bacterium]|nr:ACT domain-containing protein [Oscillospiraceae bacterium]
MKAIITVIGHDSVGILAAISADCARHRANVIEVTQSVLQDMFAMIMLIDIHDLDCDFLHLSRELKATGEEMNLVVHVMHEDVFNSMHHV